MVANYEITSVHDIIGTGYILNANDTVLITATGALNASFTGIAVAATASGNRVQVMGSLSANNYGLVLNSNSRVDNSGTVTGGEAAVVLGDNSTSGGNVLVNSGLISGAGLSSKGINVRGSASILNSGTIQGYYGINAGSGSVCTITNYGTIKTTSLGAAIQSFADTTILINSGVVDGNITLGDGADFYDGRLGRATGLIDLKGGNNIAYGGAFNDTLKAGIGDDFIDGGAGVDTLVVSSEVLTTIDLRITGPQDTGLGLDTLRNIENIRAVGSAWRTMTFIGNGVANDLRSLGGDDVLDGGAGNDTLDGGFGNDRLIGGDGFDTVLFTGLEEGGIGAYVNMANPNDEANNYGADTYISIEALIGTSFADTFLGDSTANTFTGRGGNDTLNGAGGNDTLVQEVGDGNDRLIGGSGIDTVSFSGAAGAVISLAKTGPQVTAYGSDTLIGIENLSGGSGNDRFTGDKLANTLKGNNGNDSLNGGLGNDTLSGGAGKDVFVFNTKPHAKSNKDKITDWVARDDTIQLENAVFKKLTKTGTLKKAYFTIGSKAKDSNDFIGYNKATGDLWYDSNGNKAGGQVVFANIGKNKKIAYDDFVVI